MSTRRRLAGLLCVLSAGLSAQAHPMGNFAICHYSHITVQAEGKLHLRYILDRAELPTVTERSALDSNADGKVSPEERQSYLDRQAENLTAQLHLSADSHELPLTLSDSKLQLTPGAGGLETLRVTLDLQAQLPVSGGPIAVTYQDQNYPERTGWKELLITSEAGAQLTQSSSPTRDLSAELTRYPQDVVPPQQTETQFTVALSPGTISLPAPALTSQSTPSLTPSDRFTQTISQVQLSPSLMLLGVFIAFVYGGFHALGPGHGKTMVAAYLVGTRGTLRHAVLLGAIVTVTHTLGVFALGLATLFASRYVVPERLYPLLSALSGLSVFGVGIWLLTTRLGAMPHHEHRGLEGAEGHDHGFGYHSHQVPQGPVTTKTLLALGISGGIVPCPSALIVLLASIALHRIGYGLALVTAFSCGLAAVLIVIGLLVVSARGYLERLPKESRLRNLLPVEVRGVLMRLLPILSAGAVALIGLALTLRAFPQS